MNDILNIVKNIFRHQTVQLIVAIVGTLAILFNVWWGVKNAPLMVSILGLTSQVQAQGVRLDTDEKYIPDIITTKQKVDSQSDQLNRIEGRVDSIDNFLRGYK